MKNRYQDLGDGSSIIYITSKTHGDFECLVDTEDLPRLSVLTWGIARVMNTHFYVMGTMCNPHTGGSWPILMHRLVTSFEFSIVDHKNRNTIDNRKSNLRGATSLQNRVNSGAKKISSSGYKGVSLEAGKYRARIQVSKKNINLGTFLDPISAARAYDKASVELYGEYAYTNFPTIKEAV